MPQKLHFSKLTIIIIASFIFGLSLFLSHTTKGATITLSFDPAGIAQASNLPDHFVVIKSSSAGNLSFSIIATADDGHTVFLTLQNIPSWLTSTYDGTNKITLSGSLPKPGENCRNENNIPQQIYPIFFSTDGSPRDVNKRIDLWIDNDGDTSGGVPCSCPDCSGLGGEECFFRCNVKPNQLESCGDLKQCCVAGKCNPNFPPTVAFYKGGGIATDSFTADGALTKSAIIGTELTFEVTAYDDKNHQNVHLESTETDPNIFKITANYGESAVGEFKWTPSATDTQKVFDIIASDLFPSDPSYVPKTTKVTIIINIAAACADTTTNRQCCTSCATGLTPETGTFTDCTAPNISCCTPATPADNPCAVSAPSDCTTKGGYCCVIKSDSTPNCADDAQADPATSCGPDTGVGCCINQTGGALTGLGLCKTIPEGVSTPPPDYGAHLTDTSGGSAPQSGLETARQTAGYISTRGIPEYLGAIAGAALALAGALFVFLVIYGGALIITSAGEQEKIKKGKNIIVWSIIGAVILAAAYAITTLVFQALK